jgi:hypothetical protein
MSGRTWTGYIPSGYLNSAASTSPSGSVDAETGAPIQAGLVVGAFQEFGDDEAKSYSNPNATTYPNQLYSGTYEWVQLDPAVVGTAVVVGASLWWLQTNIGKVVTTTQSANAPDFAGVSIDPNFGLVNNYAFIQVNGKTTCQFRGTLTKSAGAVYGDSVFLYVGGTTTDLNTFDIMAATSSVVAGGLAQGNINVSLYVGYVVAIGTISTGGGAGLVRITRAPSRY